MKGGVGKTTLAAHLAARLSSRHKKNILLVDLDPQQNLTEMFLTPEELQGQQRLHNTIMGLFEPRLIGITDVELSQWSFNLEWPEESTANINHLPFRMQPDTLNFGRFDLIASQFETIKYTEIGIDQRNLAIQNFNRSLEVLKRHYQYIIIDCNPSASLLTRCALQTCGRILAPIRPDQTARRGLIFMKGAMKFYGLAREPELSIVFNCTRRPVVKEEQLLIESLRKGIAAKDMAQFVGKYLQTEIPESDTLRAKYARVRPIPNQSALALFLGGLTVHGRADTPLNDLADEYVAMIEGHHEKKDHRAA
jgi:chromosome partitioning protein